MQSYTVAIWDVPTGKKLVERKLDGGVPVALAFTADGKRLLVGNGCCLRCFSDQEAPTESVSYLDRGRVSLVDAATLESILVVEIPWSVYGIATSRDGKQVAAVGSSPKGEIDVGLWDTETLTEKAMLAFPGEPAMLGGLLPLRPIVFSTDGEKLFVATKSACDPKTPGEQPGIVRTISTSTLKEIRSWEFDKGPVVWLDVLPDNRHLVVVSSRPSPGYAYVQLWEIVDEREELRMVGRLPGHLHRVVRDGKRSVSATAVPLYGEPAQCVYAAIWEGEPLVLRARLNKDGPYHRDFSFAVSEDGDNVAIGDELGVYLWRIRK